MKHKKSGFTLVESIVTLTLVLIIIGIASHSLTFLHRAILRSEIEKLYSVCMYMQRLAQMTNKAQYLTFDLGNQTYRFDGKTEKLPPHLKFGVLPEAKGPPSDPKKILKTPITFENQCITFMPHGMIQAGTVYLIDGKKTMMYALSSPVADFSYLRLYRYENGWHLL